MSKKIALVITIAAVIGISWLTLEQQNSIAKASAPIVQQQIETGEREISLHLAKQIFNVIYIILFVALTLLATLVGAIDLMVIHRRKIF